MALKGNVNDLRKLTKRLKGAPVELARAVAKESTQPLTSLAQQAYSSGKTVYDSARPLGKDGNELTLVKTGKTQELLLFVNTGTIIRCHLGTDYAPYLVGKYRILPMGAMPVKWAVKMGEIVAVQKVNLS